MLPQQCSQVATLQEDLNRAYEAEKTQQGRVAHLETIAADLRQELQEQVQETNAQRELVKSLRTDHDMQTLEMTQLEEERRRATEEHSSMAQELKQARSSADHAEAGSAEQEHCIQAMRARIHQLEEEIYMRDNQIQGMRADLQEQGAALMATLNSNAGEASKGSVLNEIEDLVMSQLKEEHGDVESTKHMTVALLQRLLPRIEETNLSNTAPAAAASASVSPTKAAGASTAGAQRAAARSVAVRIAGAVMRKRPVSLDSLAQEMAQADGTDSGDSGDSDNAESGIVVLDGSRSSNGTRSNDDGTSSKSSFSAADSDQEDDDAWGVVTPVKGTPDATGQAELSLARSDSRSTDPAVLDVPQSLAPLSPSAAPDVCTRSGHEEEPVLSGEALVNERLEQVLRLYAASTQHLAGIKIVTRETAEQMDVASLRRLRRTLLDLVAARNKLLVRTLGEREVLRTDIHLKKTVLKPVITFLRTHSPGRLQAGVAAESSEERLARRRNSAASLASLASPRPHTPRMRQDSASRTDSRGGASTPASASATATKKLFGFRLWSSSSSSSTGATGNGSGGSGRVGSRGLTPFKQRLGTELAV